MKNRFPVIFVIDPFFAELDCVQSCTGDCVASSADEREGWSARSDPHRLIRLYPEKATSVLHAHFGFPQIARMKANHIAYSCVALLFYGDK